MDTVRCGAGCYGEKDSGEGSMGMLEVLSCGSGVCARGSQIGQEATSPVTPLRTVHCCERACCTHLCVCVCVCREQERRENPGGVS